MNSLRENLESSQNTRTVYTDPKHFHGRSIRGSMGLNKQQQRAENDMREKGPYGGAPAGSEGTGHDLYDIRTGGQVDSMHNMQFPLPSLIGMAQMVDWICPNSIEVL